MNCTENVARIKCHIVRVRVTNPPLLAQCLRRKTTLTKHAQSFPFDKVCITNANFPPQSRQFPSPTPLSRLRFTLSPPPPRLASPSLSNPPSHYWFSPPVPSLRRRRRTRSLVFSNCHSYTLPPRPTHPLQRMDTLLHSPLHRCLNRKIHNSHPIRSRLSLSHVHSCRSTTCLSR